MAEFESAEINSIFWENSISADAGSKQALIEMTMRGVLELIP